MEHVCNWQLLLWNEQVSRVGRHGMQVDLNIAKGELSVI
jgi:hypothetical protein